MLLLLSQNFFIMKIPLPMLVALILLFSCSSKPLEIEGFNDYVWMRDRYGCASQRAVMLDPLMEAKSKIMGLREAEVLRLLGKPDEQEIYSRNQKFLIYFLEPNKKCEAPEDTEATAKALNIRLNAIGVANEMYISKR